MTGLVRHALAFLSVSFSAALASVASAAALQVGPIPVEIAAPASTSTMTLGNRATEPGTFQIRVLRWTQANGEENLDPTDELVASPPIIRVEPGADQTVRLVRTSRKAVEVEECYRVWVDEVVPQDAGTEGMNLKIAMRYSVPVFVEPAGLKASPAKARWTLQREPGKDWALSVENVGRQRLRLSNLSLSAADGKAVFFPFKENALVGYVLAGQTMTWHFAAPASGELPAEGPLELKVQTQLGELGDTLPAAARP